MEVIFFLEIVIMVTLCFGMAWFYIRKNAVNRLIDRIAETKCARYYDNSIEDIVMDALARKATQKLDRLVSRKEQDVINKKATERVEVIVDEWCEKFTSDNYELLLKERLKINVKDRLKRGAESSFDGSQNY